MKGDSSTSEKDSLLSSTNSSAAVKYTNAEEPVVEKKTDSGSTLIIAFVMMLLFQLGNRIFGRLETYPMHNYPMFINMLSTIIYVPICFAYIIPAVMFTNNISKEQRDIPKYKFGVMGALDSLAGIMQTFAVNYITNSSTIVLVQQSAIPISMLISKIALQARYTTSQYLGSAVVLLGIVVVLIPTFMASPTATSATTSTSSSSELIWIFVLVLSCVPMCLSSVYKEKALGEMEIDVVYLNGWVAVFQFLFSLPLCFPSASVINIPISGIWPNMVGGMWCWMGVNTLPDDNCASAPFFVSTYLCFNIVYNILIIVILKHGSANILWMASTVIVPLSNVAFSLKIMPGHKDLTKFDVMGLFVIMGGLVLYRFAAQLISCWNFISGRKMSAEDEELDKQERLLEQTAEKKQTKYVGLNQIEGIQSLFEARVNQEKKKGLFRSPQQIRGNLLLKLGIPPSPKVSLGTVRGPNGKYIASPLIQEMPKQSSYRSASPVMTIQGRGNIKSTAAAGGKPGSAQKKRAAEV